MLLAAIIIMCMRTLQIRLTRELMEELDRLTEAGIYPNRSEAVRDAVRILVGKSRKNNSAAGGK